MARPKKVETIEMEQVEQTPVTQDDIKCAVTIGITQSGDIFFQPSGTDQNLLALDGLLKYAERHMANVWKARMQK